MAEFAQENGGSIRDFARHHDRKSNTERIGGYKRDVADELDAGVVLGVAVQQANQAEHARADAMRPEVEAHGPIAEVHVGRVFLASHLVADAADAGGLVQAKPYPAQGAPGFINEDFTVDLDAHTVQCLAGVVVPFLASGEVHFPTPTCAACSQRPKCQKPCVKSGRKIHVHPREDPLKKLRAGPTTPTAAPRSASASRSNTNSRTSRPGRGRVYVGVRKSEYDLCRAGIIHNLSVIERELGIAFELAAA